MYRPGPIGFNGCSWTHVNPICCNWPNLSISACSVSDK